MFEVDDIVRFAIRIEENGEAFYREAERSAKDEGARRLFKRLADDELEHKQVFQRMLDAMGDPPPEESYKGEYMSYLRDHIDAKAVFSRDAHLSAVADARSALDFAIQRELDALHFYEEMKRVVPERHFDVLDAIVGEERKHFVELSETRKEYR
jgi:rubrerythrin